MKRSNTANIHQYFKANLSTANISTANISTANLSTANLITANLSTANFATAFKQGSHFETYSSPVVGWECQTV